MELARWPAKYGGLAWLINLRFGPHPVGRDYRVFVLIKYGYLLAVAGNVFLSDLGYALGAEWGVVPRWLVGQGC